MDLFFKDKKRKNIAKIKTKFGEADVHITDASSVATTAERGLAKQSENTAT